jgi:NitT/TauT family transport system permease protein
MISLRGKPFGFPFFNFLKIKIMIDSILNLFKPNKKISSSMMLYVILIQIFLFGLYWTFGSNPLIPKPLEILRAFKPLVLNENLIGELFTSLALCLKATGITILVSLIISYSSVMGFFKPFGKLVTKMRFLTLVGISLIFIIIFGGGNPLKTSMLTFGMTVFFVTSMLDMIDSIVDAKYNHARTICKNEWQVVLEVIIRGKLDEVFVILRQNFAMSWLMLTMVEGIVRSDGGIGVLLLANSKHFQMDYVFAIQLTVITTGILSDWSIVGLKNLVCPYSKLTKLKR